MGPPVSAVSTSTPLPCAKVSRPGGPCHENRFGFHPGCMCRLDSLGCQEPGTRAAKKQVAHCRDQMYPSGRSVRHRECCPEPTGACPGFSYCASQPSPAAFCLRSAPHTLQNWLALKSVWECGIRSDVG